MRFPFNGSFKLTQKFGENPASYAQFGLKGHNGLDFGVPTGTEIVATHSGKVIEATNDPSGYGLYVKIENDLEGSLYAHLKEFKVKVGDQVSEGQILGLSDNTGNSTGPHLHFGYYKIPRDRTNGYAGYIDPLPFLTSEPMAVITQKELDKIRSERDKNWNLYQAEKTTTTNLNSQLTTIQSESSAKDSQISSLESQVSTLEAQVKSLSTQSNNVVEIQKQLDQCTTDRTGWFVERESLNRTIGQLKRQLDSKKPKGFFEKLAFLFT